MCFLVRLVQAVAPLDSTACLPEALPRCLVGEVPCTLPYRELPWDNLFCSHQFKLEE